MLTDILNNYWGIVLTLVSLVVSTISFYIHSINNDKQHTENIEKLTTKFEQQEIEINGIKISIAEIKTMVSFLVSDKVLKNRGEK